MEKFYNKDLVLNLAKILAERQPCFF